MSLFFNKNPTFSWILSLFFIVTSWQLCRDTGEEECATVTLSVSQPISDISNLITQAMSIDEICFSVSQLSNGDRSAGDSVQKRNDHNNNMRSIQLYILN